MYTPLTHEQHLELAPSIRELKRVRAVLMDTIPPHYSAKSKVCCLTSSLWNLIDDLSCELDKLYHDVTDPEQFKAQGHAYYGGKPSADLVQIDYRSL
jgi:hypothetical protein